MKKMNLIDRLVYTKMLARYLQFYEDEYSESSLDCLYELFLAPIPTENIPDVLKQVYAAFDMLEPEENCYLQFAKMVGDRYGWNTHVLEIGGGCFPAFSKYFDEFQREHNMGGTITTYDSRLITNKLGNIKLHKENFYEDMSVQSYDLIVGIMPCDATELIVKKATLEHKEFFIAMCGCTHYDGFSIPQGAWWPSSITYEEYVEKVYNLAKKQEEDGFQVTKESAKQYSFKYPVISSRRVK